MCELDDLFNMFLGKRQVKYLCGHCEWFIITDIFAERDDTPIPGTLGKKWEDKRQQHYEDAHADLMRQMRLKRLLQGKL